MQTQTSYELRPINNSGNEWAVIIRGELLPCGTIRKLSAKTYGWHDRAGLHEYNHQHNAALACIRYARPRQLRQLQRSEDYRHSA